MPQGAHCTSDNHTVRIRRSVLRGGPNPSENPGETQYRVGNPIQLSLLTRASPLPNSGD